MSLIADKAFRYGGRQLAPGDPFEPKSDRDARVLKAIKKASDAPPPDPLDALRAEAAAAGVEVDKRWGEARLKEEIAKAKQGQGGGQYQRRDMRSET